MKKGLILKSLAAAVAVYGTAGFWGVPYLLKNVAPKKIAEATKGGEFSVQWVAFNPFTFHLRMKGVAFKTPKHGDLFTLRKFSINVDPTAYLWKGGLVIGDITLSEPKITIRRDEQGDFNFKWLSNLGSDTQEEKSSSEPMGLIIRHFTLQDGSLDYSDVSDGKSFAQGVGPIGFKIDNIDLRNLSSADGKMRLYATINDGGFLDIRGKIDALAPFDIGGSIAFKSGKLYTPWSYFREKFPIEVADGDAQFGFDYRFNSDDVNATELSNLYVGVEKLRIIPKGEQRNLLTLASLKLEGGNVLPMRKIFNARNVNVNGLNVAAERGKNGTIDWLNYIEEIQKAFPDDENETKEPWNYTIGHAAIEGVGVQWRDSAPAEPYHASVANLRLHCGTISSDEATPLDVEIATDTVQVARQKDDARVIALQGSSIEGVSVDRAGRFASVKRIALQQPSVSLKRLNDGSIDLSRYAYASKSTPKPSTQEAPWGYRLDEIDLSQGSVAFRDEVPKRAVALKFDQMHLNLRGFESNPEVKNYLTFDTRINEKSTLELKSDITRSSMRSSGDLTLKRLNVALFDPYIEPSSYASLHRGSASVSAHYDYVNTKASVKGKVALSDWVIDDSRDQSVLLGWQNIGATPFTYSYPDNRLKINQLAIDGLYANALIDAQKVFNYSTLSKHSSADTDTTKPASNPFGIDIVKLLVRNSSATFSDQSLPLPFKTYIHDLEGSVLGISTTKDVRTFVKLRGGVDQYGLAKVDGSINTKAPKEFTDIKVAFDNLELQHYTPYSLQFLGYKIDGGKLFLNLGYKIDGGKLNGANQVVIKQIELGAEKEGGSPWPMRLVVALLEDSDGVIDIDLPIEGDVNNPDFKYGKVVWQVISNLFTKAVTSPFRLLGSLMGIESDKLSSIDFEAGSAVLLPPQIEKLDQLTTMLSKRPKLMLEIYGGWDEQGDAYALKGAKLVQEALKRNKELKIDSSQAITMELLEEMADDMLDGKEVKLLKKKLEEQYPEEAAFVRHYSDALIDKLIAKQPLAPQELQMLAHKRAENIRAQLAKNEGLASRIVIKNEEAVSTAKSGDVPVRMEIVVP
ncbi:MAG: DUF748 domain-containing protein [Sulfuricurvum sp.]|uniref:DUF748 domain-containing protein n=1 Tax=Sulfuricurvum sp. TaxID=2025608 RepID=UPI003562D140